MAEDAAVEEDAEPEEVVATVKGQVSPKGPNIPTFPLAILSGAICISVGAKEVTFVQTPPTVLGRM